MSGTQSTFDPKTATPAQREVAEEIQRDRGIPNEPLSALWTSLIPSAGAARRIAKLGAHCRFDTVLSPVQLEAAMLATVYPIGFAAEIKSHEAKATKLGVTAAVLAAIRDGNGGGMPQDLRAIVQLSRAVALGSGATAAPLAEVRAQLGAQAAVDVVAVAGYYGMLYRVSQALKD